MPEIRQLVGFLGFLYHAIDNPSTINYDTAVKSSLKQKGKGEKMNLHSSLISKTPQANLEVEKALLEVFRSDQRKPRNWLRKKLENMGVESRFTTIIAKREAASEALLELNPREINHFIYSLIEEFKAAGFSERIALWNPGRLRELERLGLPVTTNTICRNPQALLKNKQELERLGLPVTINTICHNPQALLKNKQELERLGLPVTINTICRNPQTLLKNKQELERLGISVITNTICRNPQTLLKNKQELERLGLPVTINTICHNPQTLLKNKQELERLGISVNKTNICLNPKSVAKKAKRLKGASLLKPLRAESNPQLFY